MAFEVVDATYFDIMIIVFNKIIKLYKNKLKR